MMQPGLYEITSDVKIRREPRVIEFNHPALKWVTNQTGLLKVGDKCQVHSVVTDKDNATWGRISESDAAGKALWICLYLPANNRTFAKQIEPQTPPAPPPVVVVNIPTVETRVSALEAWAKTKGFPG